MLFIIVVKNDRTLNFASVHLPIESTMSVLQHYGNEVCQTDLHRDMKISAYKWYSRHNKSTHAGDKPHIQVLSNTYMTAMK